MFTKTLNPCVMQATLHGHALAERAAAEARRVQAEEAAKAEAAAASTTPPPQQGGPVGVPPKPGKGSQAGATPGGGQQQAEQLQGRPRGPDSRGITDRWGRPADVECVRLLGTVHEVVLFSWAAQLVSGALPGSPEPARALTCTLKNLQRNCPRGRARL